MERQKVDSSQIDSVGYQDGVLEVAFKKKDGVSVYQYPGVPPELHQQMIGADSVGKAFHTLIKTAVHEKTGEALYPHKKVEEDEQ